MTDPADDDERTLDEVLSPAVENHGIPIVTGDLAADLEIEQTRRDGQAR
jgi:hypothetical protein